MKNIDYIENKIELEELYIVKVKDYIKKMFSSKNQSKNILPYNIHVNDVFDMLQDVVTIENDDDYLVFFNYEFVLCLLQLGVTPNRITYIANHNDSYLLTRDGMAGRSGMRTILFDKTTYKKYSKRKQWKQYIMNKLNGKNDFIVVGNIPFTINNGVSDNSIKIGDEFIKLINCLAKKACYILPAKYDKKTFINELILNPFLKKIVHHKKRLFDINASVLTCHALLDNSKKSNEFEYCTNIDNKSLVLTKSKDLKLASDLDFVSTLNNSKKNLGDLWKRGKKYTSQLSGKGQYKVITALGSHKTKDFEYTMDNEENATIGKWKIILPLNGGGRALKIASPEFSVAYNVVALEVNSKKELDRLFKWCMEIDLPSLLNKLRTGGPSNNKSLLSKIELPDGII